MEAHAIKLYDNDTSVVRAFRPDFCPDTVPTSAVAQPPELPSSSFNALHWAIREQVLMVTFTIGLAFGVGLTTTLWGIL